MSSTLLQVSLSLRSLVHSFLQHQLDRVVLPVSPKRVLQHQALQRNGRDDEGERCNV